MTTSPVSSAVPKVREADYSLFHLMKPAVIADPYPLYRRIREYEPVHWDPFLHSWVITSYAECAAALAKHKAARTPSPERIVEQGLPMLAPYMGMMQKQILFMDAPSHPQLRTMCAAAFTPRRIEAIRATAEATAHTLLDRCVEHGGMDLIGDYANPFAATILAAMLGLPPEDSPLLRPWASDVVELIGNFEHKPERMTRLTQSLDEMRLYLVEEMERQRATPRDGVLSALLSIESEGSRMTEEQVVANVILMIAGGLEEPTNLIGCGLYSLLLRPETLLRLTGHPELMPTAIEELLRFEAPTQNTGRVAAEDVVLAGKQIRAGDSMTIVVAAANRDPLRFADPDTLDLERQDNRHLSFGWASHYCIGASLARLEGAVAIATLLRRLPELVLLTEKPEWRAMASLRGIQSLKLSFNAEEARRRSKEIVHVQ